MDVNRKTAYQVLFDMEKNKSYSNLTINEFVRKNKPNSQSFVRELVYGVLENKLLIDYYLAKLIPSGLGRVKKQDLTLLRMGLYQLIFMNSVPEYAALNETVNMAKAFCKGREGFINGVLRGYLRKKDSPQSKDLLRLPEKSVSPVEYLSVKYSVLPWIVKLWIDSYGEEKTEEILKASNETPKLSIRVNLLKTTRADLMDALKKEGFEAEPGKFSDRVLYVKGSEILESPLYSSGHFSVQDEASVLATDYLSPEPGNLVVDVCAAPGGKTLSMAEKMASEGKIFAFDIYDHKLELIKRQAERLGVNIITTECHDSTLMQESLRKKADRVLVDVPCSGLGVIRRKPEIKYKENTEINQLLCRQEKILQTSSNYLKNNGIMVYSTCTVNPAENQKQIDIFLKNNGDFNLIETKQFLPTDGVDGFYICKLKKN